MEAIRFIYGGKERGAIVVQAKPDHVVNLLYILDEELNECFGNCFLFNGEGNIYPCNAKGRKEEVAPLLYVLYKELYRLKLVT